MATPSRPRIGRKKPLFLQPFTSSWRFLLSRISWYSSNHICFVKQWTNQFGNTTLYFYISEVPFAYLGSLVGSMKLVKICLSGGYVQIQCTLYTLFLQDSHCNHLRQYNLALWPGSGATIKHHFYLRAALLFVLCNHTSYPSSLTTAVRMPWPPSLMQFTLVVWI